MGEIRQVSFPRLRLPYEGVVNMVFHSLKSLTLQIRAIFKVEKKNGLQRQGFVRSSLQDVDKAMPEGIHFLPGSSLLGMDVLEVADEEE